MVVVMMMKKKADVDVGPQEERRGEERGNGKEGRREERGATEEW
jgi:hypothetical protein